LGRFGIDARYFPDIVFRACDLYEDIDMGVSLKNKKFSIGLNLTGQAGKKLGEELLSIANQLGLDLVFISSHLSDYNLHYEYTPNTLSDNISIYCYDSPSEMLRVLSGLDILISSKLHLGVSALSLGVPFISFNGKKKTRQFFLQHELSEYLIEASQQQAVVDIVKDAPKFLLENPYPHDRIAVLKEESLKHIDYLADFIKQHIH
jgi:polysaccharide pyruvyl transferase WcaK-like protein